MRSMFAAVCLSFAGPAFAAPVAYTLDPGHTQAQVSWNHMQYSHPEAGFDDIAGTLMWDADDITRSSVSVTIKLGSIHSHVPALDEKLKSAEFLDVEHFPEARFVSTGVKRLDKKGHVRIDGNLTLHGVTQPVTLDAHLIRVGIYPMLNVPAAGFSASATIKRSAFGISEGIPYVGDDLQVRIGTEALEAKGYAKAMQAMVEQKK